MKILVIGMADSVHLSRWLSQFVDTEHEFLVVSSSPHRKIHPQLSGFLQTWQFSMPWVSRVFSLPLWIADRLLSNRLRGFLIARVARKFKPDLIHILEFQNGGYAYLRAVASYGELADVKMLLTPYGSDIYWFQQFPEHFEKIKKLLEAATAISCECRRDEVLAKKLGFKGIFGPRVPAFGAMVINKPNPDRSMRNVIAVKGYQNHWGQALNALQALEEISMHLTGKEIVLYSCNRSTLKAAKSLSERTGLQVTAYPKGALANSEVLSIFKRSILYIGLSKSDGISASMIEAMANGAVPIQSDTSCCNEWMDHGVGGYLVRYDNVSEVSAKALQILQNEDFQAKAAQENYLALQQKLNPSATLEAARRTYEMLND